MENKVIEETTNFNGGVSTSNGGKTVGLVLGALGVLGGIAAAVIYKKKKNSNQNEVVSENDVDNNESNIEE